MLETAKRTTKSSNLFSCLCLENHPEFAIEREAAAAQAFYEGMKSMLDDANICTQRQVVVGIKVLAKFALDMDADNWSELEKQIHDLLDLELASEN